MAQTIKIKRSATPAKVPATTDLDLGELAINTYDGKLYLKKNAGGVESIVEVTGAPDTGGGALSHAESLLASDVTLAINLQWYDIVSVSLAAGTWLVTCFMSHQRNATSTEQVYARITDGTNHYASTMFFHTSTNQHVGTLSMTTIITLASTTTIKGQASTSSGASTSYIKAAIVSNASGNNATQIVAVKIS